MCKCKPNKPFRLQLGIVIEALTKTPPTAVCAFYPDKPTDVGGKC